MRTLYYIFLILIFSCTNKQANETDCNEIKQIVITDKFIETSFNKKTTFKDSTSLSHFCEEIKQLQTMNTVPSVKNNFGFYLLDVLAHKGN